MELYADSRKREITADDKPVSIDEARKIFESGQMTDCTLSVHSLARLGWDWDALDAYYREMDANRGIGR